MVMSCSSGSPSWVGETGGRDKCLGAGCLLRKLGGNLALQGIDKA